MTSQELDEVAYHVAFEIVTLIEQIDFYIDNYGRLFPIGSSTTAEVQALLEAVLVHLRLLNEFFGCTGRHPDDVRACDWPGWSGDGFLSDAVRREINAHVAHLSRRRHIGQQWDLSALGVDACRQILRFFHSIPPERLSAFLNAPDVAMRGLARLTAETAK